MDIFLSRGSMKINLVKPFFGPRPFSVRVPKRRYLPISNAKTEQTLFAYDERGG
jgi:hypothetical protein